MSRVVGCSLLPVTRDPRYGNIYFILGRERRTPCWVDADRWSDFSGSVQFDEMGTCETPETTAARESWEETAGILRFSHRDKDFPIASYDSLAQSLRNGEYVMKMTFKFQDTLYVTFVYEVPFDPSISPRFSHLIKLLTQYPPHARATEETQHLSSTSLRALFGGQTHPSINSETNHCDRSFTEKAAIQLFSVPSLVDGLFQGGLLVQKFGRSEYMRTNFARRMAAILTALGYLEKKKYELWRQGNSNRTMESPSESSWIMGRYRFREQNQNWAWSEGETAVASSSSSQQLLAPSDSSESKITDRFVS